MTALGLQCCSGDFSSWGSRGYFFVSAHGLFIAVASLVNGEQVLCAWTLIFAARQLRSCGSQAREPGLQQLWQMTWLLRNLWNLPRPGIDPVSPALAGRFLSTVPPGRSFFSFLFCHKYFLTFLVIAAYIVACSVTKSCLILCNPMNCSMPGFLVLNYLPEFLKLMSIELMMPSSHLILCGPLLLLPSISPRIRVFSSESAFHIW